MLNSHFVIFGAVLNLIGGGAYVLDTLKGKTHPNRVTWVLWTLAPFIAFAAEVGKGVGLQSLMTFMVGFIPLLVVIASFVSKKAEWQLTRFDLVCGALSIVGLILWLITQEGNIAICFAIMADGLAALPTIIKSYRYPETETYLAYLCGALAAIITLLTIDNWTFAQYGFPLYILIVNSILTLFTMSGGRLKPIPAVTKK
jgi:hypothetical protein